jgi:hypothetical protein
MGVVVEKALALDRRGQIISGLPLPLANLIGEQGLFLLRRK